MATDHQFGFNTLTLHGGHRPDPVTGARAVPIYQTTSFVFDDTADAAALFALRKFGNLYTRIMNPTNAVFEERMAVLEGGVGGLATASGQSAQLLAITGLLESGDELVSAASLYGGTYTQFDISFRKLGIDTTFVDSSDPENFRRAITPKTKALFAETIGNPLINVIDIEAVAAIARQLPEGVEDVTVESDVPPKLSPTSSKTMASTLSARQRPRSLAMRMPPALRRWSGLQRWAHQRDARGLSHSEIRTRRSRPPATMPTGKPARTPTR